jgi:hypothetical protein
VVGRLHELEVLGPVGVGDDEEAVAVVLDRVLELLLPRVEDPERPLGIGRPQVAHLVGDLAAESQDHVALVLGGPHPEEEALVGLLVHEGVVLDRRPHHVPPQLEGPHGLVGLDVEERPVVPGPRRPVVGARDLVGQVGARLQVPEAHRVDLGAGGVARPRQQAGVVADVEGPEGEEVGVARLPVLVEQHLLCVDVRR